ncbi:MAG: iron ABC transporter permease, partial [Spirochaetales bacterium]|nr:iron ABC transporter permease [Spirochaetales bacterium]
TAMAVFGLERAPFRILYRFEAIILAHVFYNFPVIIRLCSRYWARMGEREEQAAALLGAGRTKSFFSITFPKIFPSLLSAASLVFIYCFLSFSIIRILGGSPKFSTVEIEIFRLARTGGDWKDTSNLAVLGTIVALFFLWLNIFLQKKTAKPLTEVRPARARKLFTETGPALSLIAALYFLVVLLLVAGPLVAIGFNSLIVNRGFSSDRQLSFQLFMEMFTRGGGILAIDGIINTVSIAFMSMLFSLLAGFTISYCISRNPRHSVLLESVFSIPLSVSSVVLGIGFLSLSGVFSQHSPMIRLVIALAHSVLSYPLVLRGISAWYQRYSRNMFHAAALAGAGPLTIIRTVDLPLLVRPLVSAGLFSFALSAGEFNIALVFGRGKIKTIPVLMYRLIGAYRFNAACAYGVLLIVISMAVFYFLEKDEGII